MDISTMTPAEHYWDTDHNLVTAIPLEAMGPRPGGWVCAKCGKYLSGDSDGLKRVRDRLGRMVPAHRAGDPIIAMSYPLPSDSEP